MTVFSFRRPSHNSHFSAGLSRPFDVIRIQETPRNAFKTPKGPFGSHLCVDRWAGRVRPKSPDHAAGSLNASRISRLGIHFATAHRKPHWASRAKVAGNRRDRGDD